MSKKYDLISIGDTTIDAFIRLHEASIHCDINKKNCQICMSFADKIPYETLDVVPAVGNSSNVAVGVARLGLKSAPFTAVGGDVFGKQILDTYHKEKVSTEFVKINPKAQTNYHFVLNFQAERTILIKHNEFQYFDVKKIGDTPWVYFSSMPPNLFSFHEKLATYLVKHPKIKMGFNPGNQMKLGVEKIKKVYRQTHVLFVNREEAQKILKIKNPNPKVLFAGLHKLGPKIILITDGPDGSYVSDGKDAFYMPIYPDPKPPISRTGAGDASSSSFMAALIYGLSPVEAAQWAPINSMNVVQHIGAQKGLLTKSQLLSLLKKSPKNYLPKKI
ncbi:MAG: hypothetical protein A2751_04115 [Candidatus Doudnabacteria bacterium RIFCSPHIGHO2_01_FULL_46_14]|uniref:Carbohydrate kinase PfkB domain-containing protein n=1 Tax=Candidatus Doudnabacteria bacterium RIFCSPHIGHO2_01_FULL_46_14 TaxID=1817824 RepID=A0A1F5NKS8_9BACT|nr:MAG: hypothetical protein A2751_04115 [Candidatus Doudnabacteria bacterium RIFCSPHIGHO2_01_FULL_46_14]